MRRRRNPRDRLPLSQLTHDQIVELSLDDFSKAEWKDELSEDERQQILDNTPDDKLEPHIRAFQRAIDRWYIYAQHADFDDDADRALDDARPDVADQYADNPPFESARLREIAPEIRTRIVDALSAENAWDRLTDDDHEEPDWTYAVGYTNLYVPHDDAIELQDLLSVVPEDAAQGVLDRAESETDICLFADPQEIRDIDTRHDVEIPYHSPREVRYKIDWDWVEVFLLEDDAVIEAMTQDFELTGLPADRRIVHRFADGGVALTLDSSDELEEEGEILDHCVGDPQHGWPQKLANRDIVIISMRPYANATKFEGGKRKLINTPWFTIAVGLYGAEPTEVLQINGYHNRPLGFPKFKQFAGEYQSTYDGGKFRPWEIERFLELLGALGLTVDDVSDNGFNTISWPFYRRYLADLQAGYAPATGAAELLPDSVRDWVRRNPRRRPRRACPGCGFCGRAPT